jgi:hypothetical protein
LALNNSQSDLHPPRGVSQEAPSTTIDSRFTCLTTVSDKSVSTVSIICSLIKNLTIEFQSNAAASRKAVAETIIDVKAVAGQWIDATALEVTLEVS